MSERASAALESRVIPERAARLPANPESRQAHTALVTAGAYPSLKPDLNPFPRSYPILTHPRASPSRTSLHAQALHVVRRAHHRWEKTKEKLQHYRRRTPETSPLYQIVYHSRDDLQFQWEARFQHQYGCLRDEVVKTFDEYLNCGILAHGAARVYCDGCKHSLLIAFSHVVSLSNHVNAEVYAPRAVLSEQ